MHFHHSLIIYYIESGDGNVRDGKWPENSGGNRAGHKSSSPITIKIEEEDLILKKVSDVLFPNELYFTDLNPLHDEGQKGQISVIRRNTD